MTGTTRSAVTAGAAQDSSPEPSVLAVDVGGTTIKGSVVHATGRSSHILARPTMDGGDALAVLRAVLKDLAAEAEDSGLPIAGAGVVTPGLVDAGTGRVAYAANLGWRDLDLRTDLEAQLGVPVAVGHDVRAASDAEALLGVARAAREYVFLALGTGIAAALVTGGRTVTGAGNAAGEVGHVIVHPGGEQCGCGQRGCLEVYSSGSAIVRRYREHGGRGVVTAEAVVARREDDPVAARVWAEAVDALALGVTTLTMALDPALIVLGGGVALAGSDLLRPLQAALGRLLVWRSPPSIELSALGPAAGRIGAAIQAFRTIGRGDLVQTWKVPTVLTSDDEGRRRSRGDRHFPHR